MKIVIDPISRIEGHGRVIIDIEKNKVVSARFQVLEFRGFEKFCENRPIWEMPLLTSKICGICPVSHHLASVKATENALLVRKIPSVAIKLRKLIQAGGEIADHCLHFFYFSLPDFILGPDVHPQKRNIIEILKKEPTLVENAIKLRQVGMNIVKAVGGGDIYPVTAIPGGMSKALDIKTRDSLLNTLDQMLPLAEEAVKIASVFSEKYAEKEDFTQKTGFMSLVSSDGLLEHYDGEIRIISANGEKLEQFPGEKYLYYIAEYIENDSWCKSPYYIKLGIKDGIYRVGPLSRLNIAKGISTPIAEKWFKQFKQLSTNVPVQNIYFYHYARCIELLAAFEKAILILQDNEITDKDVRTKVERREGEGVGVVEAPRGTLIHHYKCNENGFLTMVNIITPTTHNNLSINLAVKEAAERHLQNGELDDNAKFWIESAIRTYDPCLSCSTHQFGNHHINILLRRKANNSFK